VGAGAPEPDRGLQEPGSHQLPGHGESPSHHLLAKILRYSLHKSSLMAHIEAGNCTLKGLSYEIDFENVDENGQILA